MFLRPLLVSLCLTGVAYGTQLKPWFDEAYVPVWRTVYAAQWYDRIDTGSGSVAKQGRNHLLGTSLSMAVRDDYAFEIELAASQSEIRNFSLESGKATGRIHLLNDIIGDPVSAVAGMTIVVPQRHALNDYNLLYHGLFECEWHLSIGREISCLADWVTRWWAVGRLGVADRGSPWLSARVAWERNFHNRAALEMFVEGYGGFGSHDLRPWQPFHGYGNIQYRGVDVGLNGRFYSTDYGVFNVGYCLRAYAHNLPLRVQEAIIGWRYDFSL